MRPDDSLDSILSAEELRALLRDQDELAAEEPTTGESAETTTSSPGAKTPGEGVAVVLASRRRADSGLLAERLRASGVRVDFVRHAYGALDLLRARPYAAVLTDVALWTDGAQLLFERIEEIDTPPLVVLLTDRRTAPEARPHKAGVAGELRCPLSPMEVEAAVEQLIVVVSDQRGGDAAGSSAERGMLIGDHQDVDSAEAVIGRGESSDALLASRSAMSLGPYRWEIPWLRFFLEAQRRFRVDADRDSLFGGLLALAREVLGAEAAAVATITGGNLIVQVNVASGSRALLRDVSELVEDGAVEEGLSWNGPSIFSLDVPPSKQPDGTVDRSCRLVLLGLTRPVRSAALNFREDLRAVLTDALKRA